MTELTIVELNGENRIDSRLVAKSLGIAHKTFMDTAKKYKVDFEKLGALPFSAVEPPKIQRAKGRPESFVMLNEDQAIFAAALSRNTRKVVDFKLALTKAFAEARKKLAQVGTVQHNPLINADFCARRDLNRNKHVIGRFTIAEVFDQLSHYWRCEDVLGLSPRARLDGSLGAMFMKFLRGELKNCNIAPPSGYNMDRIDQVDHVVNVRTGHEEPVYSYPDDLRGCFNAWFHGWYCPKHLERYLKGEIEKGIPRVGNQDGIPLTLERLVYDNRHLLLRKKGA